MSSEITIREWLEEIGLEEFASAFEENLVTVNLLPSLTSDDLRELGVTALGHRKTLLAAIAAISTRSEDDDLVPMAMPAVVVPTAIPAVPSPPPQGPVAVPPPLIAELPESGISPTPDATVVMGPKPKRKGFSPGFLSISIGLHVILGLLATYWVVQTIQAERKLQFKAGPPNPSPNSRALEHKVSMKKKKNSGGAPAQPKRIAVAGMTASVTLPDMPTMPSMSGQIALGQMSGMGGAGFGQGLGFGNGAGSGMGGGTGMGGINFFGFRGAGAGLVGSFYDLKQKPDKQASGVNANNYTAIVRKWVDDGMKERELDDYFKAPIKLSTSQFMIPYMDANEAPKAYAVEKDVKPGQWLAVYRGMIQPPKDGTYHFIGAADDLLLVKVNGKLVLDASWEVTSSLAPEEITPDQYGGFPRKGYIRGEGVRFNTVAWAEIEVVIGERPGGNFWAVLMAQESGSSEGRDIPLFRLADAKMPKSDGPPFPKCDLKGPLWRTQGAGGSSPLDRFKK